VTLPFLWDAASSMASDSLSPSLQDTKMCGKVYSCIKS
jgi:hypothetical protein